MSAREVAKRAGVSSGALPRVAGWATHRVEIGEAKTEIPVKKKVTRFNSHLPFDKLPGVGRRCKEFKLEFPKLLDAGKI